MYRTRKATLEYRPDQTLRKLAAGHEPCPFCSIPNDQIMEDSKYFNVARNKYGYQYWEFMDVVDHLMIVPKRHVESIKEYTNNERIEVIDLIAEWDGKGYNVYSREKKSAMKSIPHQHIHLIKTKNKKAKFGLYLRKPYIAYKK